MDGIGPISPRSDPAAERMVLALGTAMRQAREQAAALVQLVADTPAPPPREGTGRIISTRA
jgi:hypothetical protein